MTISSQREGLIRDFLTAVDAQGKAWTKANRCAITGDASNRRYERLSLGDQTAVLMDAPPQKGEDIRPFVSVAKYLRSLNLSAPEIIAADETHGFLLIEDLGDDLYADRVAKDPTVEEELYKAAIDTLLQMQTLQRTEQLPDYGIHEMIDAATLVLDWYVPATGADRPDPRAFRTLLQDLFEMHFGGEQVMVHRDYHAENLIWLPNRDGVKRVGLLDFQDAAWGHPAYDLASLLKDARRDVPRRIQDEMTRYFLQQKGWAAEPFGAAYALCSAQRNLRIIGVFTRLCVRDGKRHYPAMIPRVWRNLQDDLEHPALVDLQEWCAENISEPNETVLSGILPPNV